MVLALIRLLKGGLWKLAPVVGGSLVPSTGLVGPREVKTRKRR